MTLDEVLNQRPTYNAKTNTYFDKDLFKDVLDYSSTKGGELPISNTLNSNAINYTKGLKTQLMQLYSGLPRMDTDEKADARLSIDCLMAGITGQDLATASINHDKNVKAMFGRNIEDTTLLETFKNGWSSYKDMKNVSDLQNKLDRLDKKIQKEGDSEKYSQERDEIIYEMQLSEEEIFKKQDYSDNFFYRAFNQSGSMTRQALKPAATIALFSGLGFVASGLLSGYAGATAGVADMSVKGLSFASKAKTATNVLNIAKPFSKMALGLSSTLGIDATTATMALQGAGIGSAFGNVLTGIDVYKLERGLTSKELSQIEGLSFDDRQMVSNLTGLTNAIIEIVTPDIFNGNFLYGNSARKLVMNATIDFIKEVGIDAFVRALNESTEEGLQAIVSAYAEKVARNLANNSDNALSDLNFNDLKDIIYNGITSFGETLPSMLITGGFSSLTLSGINRASNIYEQKRTEKYVEKPKKGKGFPIDPKKTSQSLGATYSKQEYEDKLGIKIYTTEEYDEKKKNSLKPEDSLGKQNEVQDKKTNTDKEAVGEPKTDDENKKNIEKTTIKSKDGSFIIEIDEGQKFPTPNFIDNKDGTFDVDEKGSMIIGLLGKLGYKSVSVNMLDSIEDLAVGFNNKEQTIELNEGDFTDVIADESFVDFDIENKTFTYNTEEDAKKAVLNTVDNFEEYVVATRKIDDDKFGITVKENGKNVEYKYIYDRQVDSDSKYKATRDRVYSYVAEAIGGDVDYYNRNKMVETGTNALLSLSKATGITVKQLIEDKKIAIRAVTKEDAANAKVNNNWDARATVRGYTSSDYNEETGVTTYNINLTEKATPKTIIHEVGHVLRRLVKDEELKAFSDLYGYEFGDTVSSDKKSIEAEERFAEDFAKYFVTEEAPSYEVKTLFQKIKDVIQSLIKSPSLNNKTKELFSNMFKKYKNSETIDDSVNNWTPDAKNSGIEQSSEENDETINKEETKAVEKPVELEQKKDVKKEENLPKKTYAKKEHEVILSNRSTKKEQSKELAYKLYINNYFVPYQELLNIDGFEREDLELEKITYDYFLGEALKTELSKDEYKEKIKEQFKLANVEITDMQFGYCFSKAWSIAKNVKKIGGFEDIVKAFKETFSDKEKAYKFRLNILNAQTRRYYNTEDGTSSDRVNTKISDIINADKYKRQLNLLRNLTKSNFETSSLDILNDFSKPESSQNWFDLYSLSQSNQRTSEYISYALYNKIVFPEPFDATKQTKSPKKIKININDVKKQNLESKKITIKATNEEKETLEKSDIASDNLLKNNVVGSKEELKNIKTDSDGIKLVKNKVETVREAIIKGVDEGIALEKTKESDFVAQKKLDVQEPEKFFTLIKTISNSISSIKNKATGLVIFGQGKGYFSQFSSEHDVVENLDTIVKRYEYLAKSKNSKGKITQDIIENIETITDTIGKMDKAINLGLYNMSIHDCELFTKGRLATEETKNKLIGKEYIEVSDEDLELVNSYIKVYKESESNLIAEAKAREEKKEEIKAESIKANETKKEEAKIVDKKEEVKAEPTPSDDILYKAIKINKIKNEFDKKTDAEKKEANKILMEEQLYLKEKLRKSKVVYDSDKRSLMARALRYRYKETAEEAIAMNEEDYAILRAYSWAANKRAERERAEREKAESIKANETKKEEAKIVDKKEEVKAEPRPPYGILFKAMKINKIKNEFDKKTDAEKKEANKILMEEQLYLKEKLRKSKVVYDSDKKGLMVRALQYRYKKTAEEAIAMNEEDYAILRACSWAANKRAENERAEREKAENEKASQLNAKKSDNGIYIEKAKEKHESIKTLNELYKVAESDVPFALAVMENVSKKYNTEFYARKGLKGLARAQQKIRDDYNGQANKLKDVFGGTIVIDKDKANIHDIFKSLIESNLLPIAEHKEPKDINNLVGYWDYKIICVAPNGTYFELIIIDKYINKIKMETKPQLDSNGKQLKDSDGNELKIHAIGHTLYEITRNLDSVINNNDDVLSKKAKDDLDYWKRNLIYISNDIYKNPQFDAKSHLKALSAFAKWASSVASRDEFLSITNELEFLSKVNKAGLELSLNMARANDTPSSLSQTTNQSLNISKSERLNATVNSLNNKTKDSITDSNSNIKSNYLEFINSKKDKSKSKDADLAELYFEPSVGETNFNVKDVSSNVVSKIKYPSKELTERDYLTYGDMADIDNILNLYSDNITKDVRAYLGGEKLKAKNRKDIKRALRYNTNTVDSSIVSTLQYVSQIVHQDLTVDKNFNSGDDLVQNVITGVNEDYIEDEEINAPDEVDVFKRYKEQYVKEGQGLKKIPMTNTFLNALIEAKKESENPEVFEQLLTNINEEVDFKKWDIEEKRALVEVVNVAKKEAKVMLKNKKAARTFEIKKLASEMTESLKNIDNNMDTAFDYYMKDIAKIDIESEDNYSALAKEYISDRGKGVTYLKKRNVDENIFNRLAEENDIALDVDEDGNIDYSELEMYLPKDMLIKMLKDKYEYDLKSTIANNPNIYSSEESQKDSGVNKIEKAKDSAIAFTATPQSFCKVLDSNIMDTRENGVDYTGKFSRFLLKKVNENRRNELTAINTRKKRASTKFQELFGCKMEDRYVKAHFFDKVSVPLNSGTKASLVLTRAEVMGIYCNAQCSDISQYNSLISSVGNNINKDYVDALLSNEITEEQVAEWGLDSFLTKQEREWCDFLVKELNSRTNAIANVKYNTENKLLDVIANYFPKYGKSASNTNIKSSDVIRNLNNSSDVPKANIEDRMTNQRTSELYELELDATSIWINTVYSEEHYINFAQWSKDAKDIFGNDTLDSQNMANMIGMFAGKGYEDAVTSYINRMIGWQEDMSDLSFILNKYISNMGVARIAGSVPSSLKNLISIIPGVLSEKVSAKSTGKAMSDLTRNRQNAIEFIYDSDSTMKHRTSDVFIGNFNKNETYNKVEDISKKTADKLLILMKTVDQEIANTVWLSAFYTAQEKGMSVDDSIYYASEVVSATQSTGDATALNKLQASKNFAVKSAMMFTSDVVHMYNLLYFDTTTDMKLHKLNNDPFLSKIKTSARFLLPVLTSSLAAFIGLGWLPEKDEEGFDLKTFLLNILEEMLQSYVMPPAGNIVGQVASGNMWKNSEMFPIIGDTTTMLKKTFEFAGDLLDDSKKEEDKTKLSDVGASIADFALSLAEIEAMPATLINKIHKSLKNLDIGYMYNKALGDFKFLK